jgi:dipeptide transport system ATP-binding protein
MSAASGDPVSTTSSPVAVSPAPVVEAHEVTRIYEIRRGPLHARAQLVAVGGISFSLARARTLAVVGESGCGKSTLGRVVALIEKPSSGALRLGGIDAVATGERERRALRKTVQMVFQNPYGSLNPRKRIGAILESPLAINTSLRPAERAERARAMLARVGLRREHAERYPHMFSGGQRQRIAIARALMLNPALVVADEPVSALDVSVQAQVLNLLVELQAELGLAYLFISHDLAVVRHIAHDVLVMYLGLAMEQGSRAHIFERPLHPYTQALLASTPRIAAGEPAKRIVLTGERPSPLNPPAGCVFSTRCPHVADRCRAERPPLRPVGGRLVACHYAEKFLAPEATGAGDTIVPVA